MATVRCSGGLVVVVGRVGFGGEATVGGAEGRKCREVVVRTYTEGVAEGTAGVTGASVELVEANDPSVVGLEVRIRIVVGGSVSSSTGCSVVVDVVVVVVVVVVRGVVLVRVVVERLTGT